jgi:hypothetical protein
MWCCCDLDTSLDIAIAFTSQMRQPESRRYVFGASVAGGAAAGAAGA